MALFLSLVLGSDPFFSFWMVGRTNETLVDQQGYKGHQTFYFLLTDPKCPTHPFLYLRLLMRVDAEGMTLSLGLIPPSLTCTCIPTKLAAKLVQPAGSTWLAMGANRGPPRKK